MSKKYDNCHKKPNLLPWQKVRIEQYIAMMNQWNQWQNLTAIRTEDEMMTRHIDDALTLCPFLKERGKRILDFGSGPGIPGIPLAIMLPFSHVTLLDSHGKKTFFLHHAITRLALSNVALLRCRGERLCVAHPYDYVVVRAVASLPKLWAMLSPLIGRKGKILAMKGHVEEEVASLPSGLSVKVHVMNQLSDKTRHIVVLSRIK